jgi:hypothetical protein
MKKQKGEGEKILMTVGPLHRKGENVRRKKI